MNEKDRIRLKHILISIDELMSYLPGIKGVDMFAESSLVRNASIRQLEIIGEACGALSDEFIERNPQQDWRAWKDMRNILIHQYFGVDYQRVYSVITDELPALRDHIIELLQ